MKKKNLDADVKRLGEKMGEQASMIIVDDRDNSRMLSVTTGSVTDLSGIIYCSILDHEEEKESRAIYVAFMNAILNLCETDAVALSDLEKGLASVKAKKRNTN